MADMAMAGTANAPSGAKQRVERVYKLSCALTEVLGQRDNHEPASPERRGPDCSWDILASIDHVERLLEMVENNLSMVYSVVQEMRNRLDN